MIWAMVSMFCLGVNRPFFEGREILRLWRAKS